MATGRRRSLDYTVSEVAMATVIGVYFTLEGQIRPRSIALTLRLKSGDRSVILKGSTCDSPGFCSIAFKYMWNCIGFLKLFSDRSHF